MRRTSSRARTRHWLRFSIVSVALVATGPVRADPSLSQREPAGFYWLHGGIAGTSLVAGAVLDATLTPDATVPRLDAWLGLEASVNQNMSATAASWSDRLVFAAVATPAFVEIGDGTDRQLSNHAVVYAEVLGVQRLLNAGVKHIVRRARPYTHNPDPRVVEFRRREGGDANLSFYSSHSSTAFAAAVAGSYLFAAKTGDRWSRRIIWFSELGMATATAHLRVRAGMHYYSDVVVGMVVGIGVGLAIPLLHGERYRPDAGEYIGAGAGFLLGATVPLLVSTRDATLRWGSEAFSVQVSPWTPPSGAGLQLSGLF